MAENSTPWGGIVIGDAGPYSDDDWSDIWRHLFTFERGLQGPIQNVLNELLVSALGVTWEVATGVALVDGKFYANTTVVNIVVVAPTVSTRIDRIVVRKSWAAQTCRVTRIEGIEGGGVPSMTQNDGVIWDIPLAQVSITTGGAATVTDERDFSWTPMSLLFQLVEDLSPTDGDLLVAESSAARKVNFVDRIRIAMVEPYSFKFDELLVVGNDAGRLPIPADLDSYELIYVRAKVKTAPGAGGVTIQLHNIDNAVDMLSTEITIDNGETSSETAAAPPVINAANDHVDDGDDIRIDLDAVNDAEGLQVEMGFRPR